MAERNHKASILIKNIDWLVTIDAGRRIITDGAVAISGNRIAAVGKTAELSEAYDADQTIDGRGMMALPGFVEAHIHNVQQLGRGLSEDLENPRWSAERIYPYESEMSAEDAYFSALLCQIEMIRGGTTCFVDPGNYFPDETAKATVETGMRGVITRSTFDIMEGGFRTLPEKMFRESREETLELTEDFVTRWPTSNQSRPRVRGSMSLRSLLNCSDDLCIKIAELAEKHDTVIQAHAAFNMREVSSSLLQYGVRDLVRLEKLGVLNDRWALTHMGWLSPKEMRLVVDRDVRVIHCPGATSQLAYGTYSQGVFPELLEFGVTIGLGSDAAAASNFIDMVRNMFMASAVHRDMRLDATIMPAELVLEMATLHGARVARWEDAIGSIEPEKRADIALLRVDTPEWLPLFNPISNLVFSATCQSADTVIIDGNIVMKDRKLLTLDEDAVIREACSRAAAIADRASLTHLAKPKWPIL
ncbi:MAG: amidohydrolase [Hyphomicrobiaceae bacterium]|nr:amidohydrolase [Hyphomicrobiaceae bacterium]